MKVPLPTRRLPGVPGSRGLPMFGHALAFARDARGLVRRMQARHGADFLVRLFGFPVFMVGHPEAVKAVLLDREQQFSSRLGWDHDLGRLFAGGLLLRDFDEHRQHRALLAAAFRPERIGDYATVTAQVAEDGLDRWPHAEGERRLYPLIKELTLDIAARVFLGIPLGAKAEAINGAFTQLVEGSIALIKRKVPGLRFHRGMRARRFLEDLLSAELTREKPGCDIFSRLREEKALAHREIVDHTIFLLMAAHDTLTSALTSAAWLLAKHPAWQELVREEALSSDAGPTRGRSPTMLVFRETLRMYPPVPFIARRTVAPCRIGSYGVPGNAAVAASPLLTHFLEEFWPRPSLFDPERFSGTRSERRMHSHAWYPFGSGAHMCLGMHLAEEQARIILGTLLRHFRLTLPPGYRPRMASIPFPSPKDGLRMILTPR